MIEATITRIRPAFEFQSGDGSAPYGLPACRSFFEERDLNDRGGFQDKMPPLNSTTSCRTSRRWCRARLEGQRADV
jgi:hypothetical protein